MTELDKKINSYEKGKEILMRIKKEEVEIEKLEKELKKPDVNIAKVQARIRALKKKVRTCNRELRALGLVGDVNLVGDLTRKLNELKRERLEAKVKTKMSFYGAKLKKLKEDLDEKRKKYAREHKSELMKKAEEIIRKKESKSNTKPNKSEKVDMKAILMALAVLGTAGGLTGALTYVIEKNQDNNAIVETIEENEERLNENRYVVKHQAVYQAHRVENEFGFINFRSEPSLSSDVISKLDAGKTVYIRNITETDTADEVNEDGDNNWKKAMYFDENSSSYVEGYVDANLLSIEPENEANVIIKDEDVEEVSETSTAVDSEEFFEVDKYSVDTPVLNFRNEPSVDSGDVIYKLEQGNTILLYGSSAPADETDTAEQSEESINSGHDWQKAMFHDKDAELYIGGYLDAQYIVKNNEEVPANISPETEESSEPSVDAQEESQANSQEESINESNGSIAVGDIQNSGIEAFANYPGYTEYLLKLQEKHPNWSFVPYEVNFDFNACVDAEYNARAVAIQEGYWSAPWYAPEWVLVDGNSWILPSKEAVACMMDTRNFLNEDQIFQFESMAFAENQSVDVIKAMLKDVPWANADKLTYTTTTGDTVTMDKSFAEIIYEAAKEHGVSATYLASKIMLEQGSGVTASNTACGTVDGYLGLYNYGNVNSYGFGDQIWISGLESARENGWTTPEISVNALAEFVKENYMNRGQNILYLTKYNFDGNGYPAHQYMTNFSGAYSEAQENANKYREENLINNPYTFVIPVYKNMPEKLCAMPDESYYIDPSNINGGVAGRTTVENELDNGITQVVAQISPIIPDSDGEVVQIPEVEDDKVEPNTEKTEKQDTAENVQAQVTIQNIEMER